MTMVALTGCQAGLWAREADPGVPGSDRVRERAEAVGPALERMADTQIAGRPVLAVGAQDACEAGQHNWKIDDDWDWRCTRSVLRIVDGPEVEAGLRGQHRLLVGAGCRGRTHDDGITFDLEHVVVDYWRDYAPTGIDGRAYTAKDLPEVRYTCPDGVTVDVQPSDRRDDQLGEPPEQWLSPFYEILLSRTAPTTESVRALRASKRPLHLWITVSTEYYNR